MHDARQLRDRFLASHPTMEFTLKSVRKGERMLWGAMLKDLSVPNVVYRWWDVTEDVAIMRVVEAAEMTEAVG